MTKEEQYLRDQLVNLWHNDLGQFEINGPNRSPMIDAINKRLHVPLGSPYCIGGLLVRGVEALCTQNKLANPVVMTAGTQDFYQRAPLKFKTSKGSKKKALKGDIGILQNKGNSGLGHAFGFTVDETDKQTTCEYNTNKAGSRNGDGVYELTRDQGGTLTKRYLGSVDVVSWILSVNSKFKLA